MPSATPHDASATIAFLPPSYPPTNSAQLVHARKLAQEAQAVRNQARQATPGGVWVIVRLAVQPTVTEEPL